MWPPPLQASWIVGGVALVAKRETGPHLPLSPFIVCAIAGGVGLGDLVKRYTWLERRYCSGPSMIPGPLFFFFFCCAVAAAAAAATAAVVAVMVVVWASTDPTLLAPPTTMLPLLF